MNFEPVRNVKGDMMIRALLLTILLALASTPALAADGPGTAAVRAGNQAITALLKQKPTPGSPEERTLAGKVTESVKALIDIDELGKRAMADHWARLAPAQQRDFLTTLRDLINDNYVRGLRANIEYTVDYTDESTAANGDVIVTTTINTKRRNRPYKIEIAYVLRNVGGKLRAWDVRTDGVGLVENYRIQFNKIVEKDGFAGLIAKMKKKRGEQGT